jgi:hypothetical protein
LSDARRAGGAGDERAGDCGGEHCHGQRHLQVGAEEVDLDGARVLDEEDDQQDEKDGCGDQSDVQAADARRSARMLVGVGVNGGAGPI